MKTLIVILVAVLMATVSCEPEELPEPIDTEVPEVPVPEPDPDKDKKENQQDRTS